MTRDSGHACKNARLSSTVQRLPIFLHCVMSNCSGHYDNMSLAVSLTDSDSAATTPT